MIITIYVMKKMQNRLLPYGNGCHKKMVVTCHKNVAVYNENRREMQYNNTINRVKPT